MNELLLSKNYGARVYIKKGKIVFCFNCGKEIYKNPSQLKQSDKFFCSRDCFTKGKSHKPRRGKIITCFRCGKKAYRRPGEPKRKTSFCSRECRKGLEIVQKKKYKCIVCGKDFFEYSSYVRARGDRKYCSVKCRTKAKKGKGSSSWKKGSSYKKFLWRVFSKYIRQRDKGVCISCGKTKDWKEMDAGHYIPRTASLSLYFDEINVNCQCTYCNRWMHGNLSRYAIALQRKYGKDVLEELDKKRNTITRISIPKYQELIDYYKEKLKQNNWEI